MNPRKAIAMTRKHFEQAAKVCADLVVTLDLDAQEQRTTTQVFVAWLRTTNPNFDAARFCARVMELA
jgi:hypothetical protein